MARDLEKNLEIDSSQVSKTDVIDDCGLGKKTHHVSSPKSESINDQASHFNSRFINTFAICVVWSLVIGMSMAKAYQEVDSRRMIWRRVKYLLDEDSKDKSELLNVLTSFCGKSMDAVAMCVCRSSGPALGIIYKVYNHWRSLKLQKPAFGTTRNSIKTIPALYMGASYTFSVYVYFSIASDALSDIRMSKSMMKDIIEQSSLT